MNITPEIVARTAQLAQLALSESEKQSLTDELNNILNFITQLESVDTTDIEPIQHPFSGMTQPLREDRVTEANVRTQMQAIAPQIEDGLYLVPAVIDAN